jgi:hypothetical protein
MVGLQGGDLGGMKILYVNTVFLVKACVIIGSRFLKDVKLGGSGAVF